MGLNPWCFFFCPAKCKFLRCRNVVFFSFFSFPFSTETLYFVSLWLVCCQKSSALVLIASVRLVWPAFYWELHSTTHYSGLRAYCLLSFFCSLCLPHSKTEKQRKSSRRDRGRGEKGGGRQCGMEGLALFIIYLSQFIHYTRFTRNQPKRLITMHMPCIMQCIAWRLSNIYKEDQSVYYEGCSSLKIDAIFIIYSEISQM